MASQIRDACRPILRGDTTVRDIITGKGVPDPGATPDRAVLDRAGNEVVTRFGPNVITRV